MRVPSLCGAILALLPAIGPADAVPLPAPLEAGGEAEVMAVIDGDTVVLDDGREVRLVGIQSPKLPLGRPDFPTWPLAEEARQALEALVLGQRVALGYGGLRTDRHGRVLAHLFRIGDGAWVQGAMLAAGMARVYTFPDNRSMVAEMLAEERAARAEALGIWALDHYAVRDHEALVDAKDSFQLVEGTVLEVAVVRERVYLNFGADYRTDFTIVIAKDDLASFEDADYALDSLAGRQVRVRGWIDFYNGPMIAVTHPEQIEVL
ncbi:MAG: thermonuclease family protein [Alphaproteobacteria bacterium]